MNLNRLNKMAVAAALLATTATGFAAIPFTDTARVVQSQPVWAYFSCSNSGGSASGGTSILGSAVGGIAGGLLGNQVGGGNGKTAATAVGAVVGAMTGSHLASSGSGSNDGQDCAGRRVTSYDVVYEYGGTQYRTTTRRAPGETIAVQVTQEVTPLQR